MHTLNLEKTSLAAQASNLKMENKKNDETMKRYN
jgi:hypothetical protein